MPNIERWIPAPGDLVSFRPEGSLTELLGIIDQVIDQDLKVFTRDGTWYTLDWYDCSFSSEEVKGYTQYHLLEGETGFKDRFANLSLYDGYKE